MLKPKLKPGDFHLVVNGRDNVAKMYDHKGNLAEINGQDKIRCHPHGWAGSNQRTVGGDTIEQLWRYGLPQWTQDWESLVNVKRPYGPVFIPMFDYEGKEKAYGRAGIGSHGEGNYDGSYTPQQPLRDTSGCIRYHNRDVVWLAQFVEKLAKTANILWLTVDQPGGEGQV